MVNPPPMAIAPLLNDLRAYLKSSDGAKFKEEVRSLFSESSVFDYLWKPVGWVLGPLGKIVRPIAGPALGVMDSALGFLPFYNTFKKVVIAAASCTVLGAGIWIYNSYPVQYILFNSWISPIPYFMNKGAQAAGNVLSPVVDAFIAGALNIGKEVGNNLLANGEKLLIQAAEAASKWFYEALETAGGSVITLTATTAGTVAGKIASIALSAVTSFSIQGTIKFASSLNPREWAVIATYGTYIGLIWHFSERKAPAGVQFHRYTPKRFLWKWLSQKINRPAPAPIFNKKLSEQIDGIIKGIQNTIKNGVVFDNLLLEGPPGTGKTMIANEIAEKSGCHLVKMSGSSLAEYIEQGNGSHIKKLREILDFAEYQARFRPTILFIDEIDVFLQKLDKLDTPRKELLNLFLSRTGTPSNRLMIIGTTNYAKGMIQSGRQRFGTILHVGNPDRESRAKILKECFDQDLPMKKIPERASVLNTHGIHRIAAQTHGVAGRELRQLTTQLIRKRGQTNDNRLTEALVDEAVHDFLQQRRSVGLISDTGTWFFDFWHFTLAKIRRAITSSFSNYFVSNPSHTRPLHIRVS